jgi:hypothetical protein
VSDLLRDQSNRELTGWFEYLHMDDEVQTNRLIYAIVKAFNGDKAQSKQQVDDDGEVIDTTDPSFLEHFQGFTGAPGRRP